MTRQEQTYWNGEPTPAERGTAIVAEAPEVPMYWARTEGIIGDRIAVVRVALDATEQSGDVMYLDDRDGKGWAKVTEGRGGPRFGHSNVTIVPDSYAPPVVFIDPREWVVTYSEGSQPFPFVEDENANITGLCHQDPETFNAEIRRYDREVAGMGEEELVDWSTRIIHGWARVLPDGERLELVGHLTVGAFPVTMLWGQR